MDSNSNNFQEGTKMIDSNFKSFYEDISRMRGDMYTLHGFISDIQSLKVAMPELVKKYRTLTMALSPYIEDKEKKECEIDCDVCLEMTQTYLYELEYLETNPKAMPPSKELYKLFDKIFQRLNKIMDEQGLLARTEKKEIEKSTDKIKRWLK